MGRNWKKQEEIKKTEEKTRPKVKSMTFLLFTLLIFFNPFDQIFLVKTCVFLEKIYVLVKTFFL